MLDTDVIFSRVLYELFGRIGSELRLLNIIWSDELLGEAERVLIERKPLPPEAARRWVGYLREAFPDGRVDLSTLSPSVPLAEMTSDTDDEHVCALAVAGNADILIAADQGYVEEALGRHGIKLAVPDEVLSHWFDEEPDAVANIVVAQGKAWGGGRPVADLLEAIERAQAPQFVERMRRYLAAA